MVGGLSCLRPVTSLVAAGANGATHAGIKLAPIADREHSRETRSPTFDTLGRCTYHYSGAEVAQLVEHSTENAGVVSSILTLGTADGPSTASRAHLRRDEDA